MYVLWRVIVKELLQIRRDRRMLPVIFVSPVVMVVVFGFAVNTDVTDVPLVLADQDRSVASRDLVTRFVRSGYFEVVGTEERAEDVDRWLVTSRAQLGLVVAPGFGAALASGRTAGLQVVEHGPAERPTIRVGKNRQDSHGWSFPTVISPWHPNDG